MNLVKNYSLSLVLCFLFLISWAGQGYFQWREFVSEQDTHNQPSEIPEFIDSFMKSTLENWQSEFLQLFSFVVLSTFLIHKGSPQSKDGDEEMKKMLENIQKKLNTKNK